MLIYIIIEFLPLLVSIQEALEVVEISMLNN